MKRLLLALAVLLCCASQGTAQTVTFLESGSDATFGTHFYSFAGGSTPPATDNTQSVTGPRSIKLTGAAVPNQSRAIVSNVVADAGTRVSFYWRASNVTTAATAGDFYINTAFHLSTTVGGVLTVNNNGGNTKDGTTVLSTNTWYRISIAWVITSQVNFTIKVFLNGTPEITVTQADYSLGATSETGAEWCNRIAGATSFIDDVYIDNGSTLDDPGAIHVTAKLPAATNTNSFDTTIGSATNRYDYVNERGLSESKGLEESANHSQVAESFGLQAAASGDVDISSGQTLIGRTAWVWAKKGTATGATPALLSSATNNSVGTAGTTLAVSLSASAGDLVVCTFADQVGGSAPTIADGNTNSYTALNTSTNTVRKTSWFSRVTGNPSTITVTFGSSSSARALACGRFSEIQASPLDTNPTDANDSTSPYDAPLSGTLATSNELVVGTFGLAGPSSDTIAAGGSEGGVITAATNGGDQQAGSCTNQNKASGTSLTCSGIGGAANDLVVVVFADQVGGSAPTIADSSAGTNTYSTLTGGTNTVRCTAWYSRLATAPGTITISFGSSSASRAVAAYRWTGAPASSLDKNPAMVNDTTSPYAGPSSTGLTQANEFVAGYGCLAGTDQTLTASTDTTSVVTLGSSGGNAATNSQAYVTSKLVSAATAVAPTVTAGTNRTGIVGTSTFKRSGNALTTDVVTALSYRIVAATTSIQPEITDTTANRTGATGTASFKGTTIVNATPQLTSNGSDTALTLSTSSALYTVTTTSASYPSNVAGIGMKSGAPEETYFYEGGVLIAYKAAPVVSSCVPTMTLLGVSGCQ